LTEAAARETATKAAAAQAAVGTPPKGTASAAYSSKSGEF
jgi:hypothetical protein